MDRFLDPVGSCLTPEVAKRLIKFRADAKMQKRLDQLAEKNQEGERSEKNTVRLLKMNAEDRLKVRAALRDSGELE